MLGWGVLKGTLPRERVLLDSKLGRVTTRRIEIQATTGLLTRATGRAVMPLECVDSATIASVHHPVILALGIVLLAAYGAGVILILVYFLMRRRAVFIRSASSTIEIPVSPNDESGSHEFLEAVLRARQTRVEELAGGTALNVLSVVDPPPAEDQAPATAPNPYPVTPPERVANATIQGHRAVTPAPEMPLSDPRRTLLGSPAIRTRCASCDALCMPAATMCSQCGTRLSGS